MSNIAKGIPEHSDAFLIPRQPFMVIRNITGGILVMSNSGGLTFARLLGAFNKLHRQRGKDLQTACPNAAAHKHGDRKPSCNCIEAQDGHAAGFNCFVCGIHGTAWDLAGWLCGFDGYQGHEAQIRDKLIELGVISSDPKCLPHTQGAFPEHATWFCLYPSLLPKIQKTLKLREAPLKEALLLSTVIYYVNMNQQKFGRDFWNCSMKKVREKFLPFFSEATLWRSTKRLQAAGLISTFTDHRKTVWRVHLETLHKLQSKSFPLLVGNGFQSERTEQLDLPTSGGISKSAEPILELVENSREPQVKNGKKETLLSNSSIPTLDIPVVEHLDFHTERQPFHTERTFDFQTVLSQDEIAAIKEYSNDFEKDAPILAKFKEIFGGSFINFRVPDSGESEGIMLTSNRIEKGKRLWKEVQKGRRAGGGRNR